MRVALYAVFTGCVVVFTIACVWMATPPLGTFEDECFMPTDEPDQYSYRISRYLRTCGSETEPPASRDFEWLSHWLSTHQGETEKRQQQVQQEIQHLEHVHSQCESAAARCTPGRLIRNFGDCLARRFDSAPWREQARALDALIREKRVEEQAQEIAYCIYSEELNFWVSLWPRQVPEVLTSEECCARARLRGPDVLGRLPSLGVICKVPDPKPAPTPLRKRKHIEGGLGPVPTTPGAPPIARMKSQNPLDGFGRVVYIAPDDTCFVSNGSPYDAVPTSRITVNCPTDLDESAWISASMVPSISTLRAANAGAGTSSKNRTHRWT